MESIPYSLSIDADGAVYAVARINGRTDMDPGLGTFYLDGNDADALLKFDAQGNFAWARSFGSDAVTNFAGIAVDDAGHIFLASTFEGSVDFDLGPQGLVLTSQGNTDFAIVKLSQGVVLPVDPGTISEDLQDIVDALRNGSTATPVDIKLSITTAEMQAVVVAIESLGENTTGPTVILS